MFIKVLLFKTFYYFIRKCQQFITILSTKNFNKNSLLFTKIRPKKDQNKRTVKGHWGYCKTLLLAKLNIRKLRTFVYKK